MARNGMPSLHERLAAIRWLLVDVDGVLTDGSIIYSDQGAETKAFHVRDGSGLKLWAKLGLKSGILTGRSSPLVARRAAELDMAVCVQGVHDKLAGFDQILREQGIAAAAVCYVGDDLPDVPVLRHCGVGVAVADACEEARAAACHVTRTPGGRGAVRETIEWVLRAQGRWQTIVDELFRA